MGARIKGAGTDTIKIRGGKNCMAALIASYHDQIEAGTLMIAAAATKGDVTVKNVVPVHMEALTAKLEEMGVQVEKTETVSAYAAISGCAKSISKPIPIPDFRQTFSSRQQYCSPQQRERASLWKISLNPF